MFKIGACVFEYYVEDSTINSIKTCIPDAESICMDFSEIVDKVEYAAFMERKDRSFSRMEMIARDYFIDIPEEIALKSNGKVKRRNTQILYGPWVGEDGKTFKHDSKRVGAFFFNSENRPDNTPELAQDLDDQLCTVQSFDLSTCFPEYDAVSRYTEYGVFIKGMYTEPDLVLISSDRREAAKALEGKEGILRRREVVKVSDAWIAAAPSIRQTLPSLFKNKSVFH